MADRHMSILSRLAALLRRAVSPAARARARLHLIDWLCCTAAGQKDGLSLTLAAIPPLQAHASACPILGRGHASAFQALLIHAADGSALEMDDLERRALLHPGPVVIPAALAAAAASSPLAELLDGIVRGYEAMIRIGRALGPGHYRFWHPSSTAGPFGAAAAVASLLGLSTEATAHALATAGSRTGGLWQMRHEPVPTKRLHFALAAFEGFLAAHWAAAGIGGPLSLLEGPQGLFAATAPGAYPEAVLAEAPDWLIFETSFKPYPACRHAHPALDALAVLLPLDPERIRHIEVETYAAAVDFCDRPQPRNEQEARFSIQHALAARLLLGDPAPAHYRPPWLAEPRLVSLRERIHLSTSPALGARFPAHFGARVQVELAGGEKLQALVEDASGDPERPLAREALERKAKLLLAEGGFQEEASLRLLAFVLEAPETEPLSTLFAAIAGSS
jgi:2-methylcitrate dehydratase PrpD